ncbi:MAG: glycosyltransferase [Chitinophagaceae bacterium]
MPELAIVIPAYKVDFLDEALLSLSNQSNRNFEVYVGDDASPFNIKQICNNYKGKLTLHYHRFDTNLGAIDLVKQWERCVSMIKPAKWLWLFSDDDIAETGCVESFYHALNETEDFFDVYRFNITVIDKYSAMIAETPLSPKVENAMSLAYNILMGKRGNSMPEHIFRFEMYKKLNGFVNFPFAQAADWATSINFAYDKGLFTIEGPKVKWRKSDESVSTLAKKNNNHMIFGHIQFIEWVIKRFDADDESKYKISRESIKEASLFNLKYIIQSHYDGIPYSRFWKVVKRIAEVYNISFYTSFNLCFRINQNIEIYYLKVRLKPLFVKAGLMKT